MINFTHITFYTGPKGTRGVPVLALAAIFHGESRITPIAISAEAADDDFAKFSVTLPYMKGLGSSSGLTYVFDGEYEAYLEDIVRRGWEILLKVYPKPAPDKAFTVKNADTVLMEDLE